MQRIGFRGWVASALLFVALPARSDVITLSPAQDTCLFELQPDFNFGAQEDLPSGTLGALAANSRSRLLIKFDLAGNLPSNAVIRSASLKLSVTRVPDGGGANSAFALHRMIVSWGEGTKRGSAPGGSRATTGEATWLARFFPDQLWSKPGGEAGVDFAAESTSSERVQGTGSYELEFATSQIEQLTDWLRNPESNFGWMLLSQSEDVLRTGRRFAAREHPETELRPMLTIDFTPGVSIAAPKITGIVISEQGATIVRFTPQPSVRYRLEATSKLPTVTWQPATDYVLANTAGELFLTNGLADMASRFYRVAAVE
jgi:hypothetical protein